MNIEVACYGASGPKARQCAFLANRFDSEFGFRPADGESWIAFNNYTIDFQGTTRVTNGTAAWYTGLWSTLDVSIFVTRHDGWIIHGAKLLEQGEQFQWQNYQIADHTLWGVFGIDEANVFVWGSNPKAQAGLVYPPSQFFRRDGDNWRSMPGPGFKATAVHGTAPDNLWAGGANGEVARWNGSDWKPVKGIKGAVLSVWVADDDEVYATTSAGAVMHGRASGFKFVGSLPGATLPDDVACVAKWHDGLWVGSPRLGVFRRIGETADFECVKPNIPCVGMDARDELVMCATNRVSGTADGVEFRSYGTDSVMKVRAEHALGQNLG